MRWRQVRGQQWRSFVAELGLLRSLRFALYYIGCKLVRRTPKQPAQFLWSRNKLYRTVHMRPRMPSETADHSLVGGHQGDGIGIVVQGDSSSWWTFTRETLRWYRRIYPKAAIVLSTWQSDQGDQISGECDAIGVRCVMLERPVNPGPSNLNMQIVSTQSGLEAVSNADVSWVVKTRTDQRVYARNFLATLANLEMAFPINSSTRSVGLKSRIIVESSGTLLYRPFNVSDQFQFGTLEDLTKYWSLNQDPRAALNEGEGPLTLRQLAERNVAETRPARNFASHLGLGAECTLGDYWFFMANAICVVDTSMLDIIWPKYSQREYRWRRYKHMNPHQSLEFSDWLTLYLAEDARSEAQDFEFLLDLPELVVPRW